MSHLLALRLPGADGKTIRADRLEGHERQLLFITGLLSKRWGTKSNSMAEWCREKGWGFCCYDVRGYGESEGSFTDYTLSDWIEDARTVLRSLLDGPPMTIVGSSLGAWIAWFMGQELEAVEELILIAPAFDMMGQRAREISPERRARWERTGFMPWDDDAVHKDWPLSWTWVGESESYRLKTLPPRRRVRTTILHGLQDDIIRPSGSWRFLEQVVTHDPRYPVEAWFVAGDHRLSDPAHLALLRRLVRRQP